MTTIALPSLILCAALGAVSTATGVEAPPVRGKIPPPTPEWTAKIKNLAPEKPRVAPKKPRKILVFTKATGYKHAVMPYVKEVVDVLGATGAFDVVHSENIDDFPPENLGNFDALVLNNTCSKNPGRNLFRDVLEKRKDLTAEQKSQKAGQLEKNILDYVASGKGLVAVHGAIVFLNQSKPFKKLLGANFTHHLPQQRFAIKPVDATHPLVAAFRGEPFIHTDEPYLFDYADGGKDLRPLLEFDLDSFDKKARKKLGDKHHYVSWIKRYGKGRVFFVSPSHNPESYETESMLQFYLDGIQYALGDLDCDDSPAGGAK
jgi:type 1 glutamine amidotransferase